MGAIAGMEKRAIAYPSKINRIECAYGKHIIPNPAIWRICSSKEKT